MIIKLLHFTTMNVKHIRLILLIIWTFSIRTYAHSASSSSALASTIKIKPLKMEKDKILNQRKNPSTPENDPDSTDDDASKLKSQTIH